MTKNEVSKAFRVAKTRTYSDDDLAAFSGCAYWKKKHHVTLAQAAAYLRYQALQFDGEWDAEALKECFWVLSNKAILVDGPPLNTFDVVRDKYGRECVLGAPSEAPDAAWLASQAVPTTAKGKWWTAFPLTGGAVMVKESEVEYLRRATWNEVAEFHGAPV